jgi:hypothetical protein
MGCEALVSVPIGSPRRLAIGLRLQIQIEGISNRPIDLSLQRLSQYLWEHCDTGSML